MVTKKAHHDIRHAPTYGVGETGHYLRVPASTIRWWVTGRSYHVRTGHQVSKPIIDRPDPASNLLSFINLVEIHVLDAIRRQHRIPLDKVRIALQYLKKEYGSRHPLAEAEFETDGLDLFVQQYGRLINISQAGQLAMKELLQAHLHRIERDRSGLPLKLFPFTRKCDSNEPKAVVIDPFVSFGRPILQGTGIPTTVIAERYKAGESMDDLAKDYDRSRLEIEEAIRCELAVEAA